MTDDLSDHLAELRALKNRVKRLENGAMLQNSSIDRGALTVRSPEGLNVGDPDTGDGSAVLYGDFYVRGGAFHVEEGNLTVEEGGSIRVLGGGAIHVDDGGDINVNDGGGVNVEGGGALSINGGSVHVNNAGIQHINDGGSINVESGGDINVYGGGSIHLHGDGEVHIAGGVPIYLKQGSVGGVDQAMLQFGGTNVAIYANQAGGKVNLVIQAGAAILQLNADGVHVINMPTAAGTAVGVDPNGRLVKLSGGSGGNGVFEWPFPLELVTSPDDEFRTPARPNHDGIDFGLGIANVTGTPIPAAGAGTVEVVGSPSGNHGWGYFVLLNHGVVNGHELKTRYAHMYQTPDVAVGQQVALRQTLGGIGNTGNSFGNHLHFETIVDGSPINPRDFMTTYGS